MTAARKRSSQRLVSSRALLREINEQIRLLNATHAEGSAEYLCECGRGGCERSISTTLTRYAEIRRDPRRFIVLAGHEDARAERVVEDYGSWVVVEPLDEEA